MSRPSLRVHAAEGAAEAPEGEEVDGGSAAAGESSEAPDATAAADAAAAASLAASLRSSEPEAPARRSTQRKGSVILAAARTACSWRSWRFC